MVHGALRLLLLAVLALLPLRATAGEAPPAIPDVRLGTPLVVVLAGGEEVEGAFVGVDQGALELSTASGRRVIPLPLVEAVRAAGSDYAPEAFMAGVQRWSLQQAEAGIPTPHPLLVGGLSALWSGAGFLALGEPAQFWTWSAVELVLLGTAGLLIYEGQYGQLVIVALVDGVVRAWAVGDGVREARRRRIRAGAAGARLSPAVLPGATPVAGVTLHLWP